MKICSATLADIPIIAKLAKEIWPIAYGEILSKDQMDYMLATFYDVEALKIQMIDSKHRFYLIQDDALHFLGFVSFEINCLPKKTKIHKLYMLPSCQGLGLGKLLVETVVDSALKENQQALFLNVNKYNKALHFYKKLGFKVVSEEVIDIGNNYVMDDFVMELAL